VTTADRVPVTLTSTWAKVSCARWWATSGSMPMDHTVHTVATVVLEATEALEATPADLANAYQGRPIRRWSRTANATHTAGSRAYRTMPVEGPATHAKSAIWTAGTHQLI